MGGFLVDADGGCSPSVVVVGSPDCTVTAAAAVNRSSSVRLVWKSPRRRRAAQYDFGAARTAPVPFVGRLSQRRME